MLYISKELYTAFIKMQADKELGRSYTGLLALTEGMYRLGYISKDVYDRHFQKYTVKYVDHGKVGEELTVNPTKEQKHDSEIDAQFSLILHEGLDTLNVKSQKYWIAKAEAYRGARALQLSPIHLGHIVKSGLYKA